MVMTPGVGDFLEVPRSEARAHLFALPKLENDDVVNPCAVQ